MTIATNLLTAFALCFLAQPSMDAIPTATPEKRLASQVTAEIRMPRTIIPVGQEAYVEFVIQNKTDQPVKLTVPGALEGKARPDYGMGLPLEHVFSGVHFRGLEVASETNPRMGDRVTRRPEFPVPPVTIAPFASIGLRFDVARFYPGLHQTGTYLLEWRPYGGALEAEPIILKVVQYKQVILDTNYGTLAMHLLYDRAPAHAENFLALIQKRFYNGLTFHSVYPGQFILGGCPNNDGTGKRADGVCLPPEFNDTPFDLGTVGMALIESDVSSASCQFFICLGRQPGWDGRYTAFAQISGPESLETLRKLGAVEVGEDHQPKTPLKIKSLTAIDVPYTPRQPR